MRKKDDVVLFSPDIRDLDTAALNGYLQALLLQIRPRQALLMTTNAQACLTNRFEELADATLELLYQKSAFDGKMTAYSFATRIYTRMLYIRLKRSNSVALDIRRNL